MLASRQKIISNKWDKCASIIHGLGMAIGYESVSPRTVIRPIEVTSRKLMPLGILRWTTTPSSRNAQYVKNSQRRPRKFSYANQAMVREVKIAIKKFHQM